MTKQPRKPIDFSDLSPVGDPYAQPRGPTPVRPIAYQSQAEIEAGLAAERTREPLNMPPDTDRGMTADDMLELRRLLAEIDRRDSLALKLYRPLPQQVPFHNSTAKERICYGTNRGAKTTATMVELARMLLGVHPLLSGKSWGVPFANGRYGICANGHDHISRVVYPKLFLPGAIKMIRDRDTGRLRSWRGYLDPEDGSRLDDVLDAPPLIPPEAIAPRGIAWLVPRRNIPKRIVLNNGTELRFFTAESEPPRGDDYNGFLFEEEQYRKDFYPEIVMRLGTRHGYFMWSATAQDGGDDMYELYERAMRQVGDAKPRTQAFFFSMDSNPYYDPQERENAKEKLRHRPDEYRARILGEWLTAGFRVYPEFNTDRHSFDMDELTDGKVPSDWARWIVIDPGRQKCAVMFFAMPPSGQMLLAYDELLIRDNTMEKFGEAMAAKMGADAFEAIIIDNKGSAQSDTIDGTVNRQHYFEALHKHGLWNRVRDKNFVLGIASPKAGRDAVHTMLHFDDETPVPFFRVAARQGQLLLENFETQMRLYSYVRKRGEKTPGKDPPTDKIHSDLPDCTRYMALYNPRYRKPAKQPGAKGQAAQRFADIMASERKGRPSCISFGPANRFETESIYVSP